MPKKKTLKVKQQYAKTLKVKQQYAKHKTKNKD